MELEYCDDCHRAKGIGCVCGIPFKDRIKMVSVNYATWSDTRGDSVKS